MNRIYKVIWSKIKQSFVVVSECSKTQGKGTVHDDRSGSSALSGIKKGVIAAVILLAFGGQAFAEKVYVHVNTGDPSQGEGDPANDNGGEPGEKGGAKGNQSIAIGISASAVTGANDAIVIGSEAKANNIDVIAIGKKAEGTSSFSVAIGSESSADGDSSVALGKLADAAGDYTIALGNTTQAAGESTVAIGTGSNASGIAALALSNNAAASGNYTIALGNEAQANGDSAVAMGSGANALAGYTVALGNNAHAEGFSSITMGSGSLAQQNYTVALGNDAHATMEGAVALGKDTEAIHTNSVALGRDARTKDYASVASVEINSITYDNFAGADTVTGVVSVGNTEESADPAKKNTKQIVNVAPGAIDENSTDAINGSQLFAVANKLTDNIQDASQTYFHFNDSDDSGIAQEDGDAATNLGSITDKAGATGDYSVTAGVGAKATKEGGIAIGHNATATGIGAVVIGGGGTNTANRANSLATGHNTTASGSSSTAMGEGTTASGSYSIAVGNSTIAQGESSFAAGEKTKALRPNSMAMGKETEASGYESTALGFKTTASGSSSIAMGQETKALGNTSTAMGRKTEASGSNSTAMGRETKASGVSSTAMGYKSEAKGGGSLATGGNQSGNKAGGIAYTDGSMALGTGTVAGTDGGTEQAVAIGYSAQATANNSLVIGFNASATDENSVALGEQAETKAFTPVTNAVVNGVNYGGFAGTANGVVSVGKAGFEKQIVNVAPGVIDENSTDAINGSQLFAVANKLTDNIKESSQTYFHFNDSNDSGITQGDGDAATNLGSITDKAGATGEYAIAAGINTVASGIKSVAVGLDATASAGSAIALGNAAEAVEDNAVALGNAANAKKESAVAIGAEAKAEEGNSVAIGYGVTTEGQEAVGIGVGTTGEVKGQGSLAMGSGAKTKEEYSIAIGGEAEALKRHATAIGFTAKAKGFGSTAIGRGAEASKIYATAIGIGAKALKDSSIAIGLGTEASGVSSIAMGYKSEAKGIGSLATGGSQADDKAGGIAYTDGSMALGTGSVAGTDGGTEQAVAIGYSAQATANNSLAVGFNASATDENSVALGEQAETKAFTPVADAVVNGVTYGGFAGTANGVVSVGKPGFEKQIVNVAPGGIDENSTDAINGSQLFAVANKLTDNMQEASQTYFHFNKPDMVQGVGDGTTNLGVVTDRAGARGSYSVTAGVEATAGRQGGIAIGYKANAAGLGAVVIGGNGSNEATGNNSLALGSGTKAFGSFSTAIGSETEASGNRSTAMGWSTKASGIYSTAMGAQTEASGVRSTAMGYLTKAKGEYSTAMGYSSEAIGTGSLATGGNLAGAETGGKAYTDGSMALGTGTVAGTDGGTEQAVAIGYSAQATANNSLVIGFNASATDENSVALGEQAETKAFTPVANAVVNGVTYGGFAGTANGVVSVGKPGAEKQIVNVAPGVIDENSTDAINGSQLFAVANKLTDNIKESSQTYFHFNDPGITQGDGDAATNLGSVTDRAGATGNYSVTAGVNAQATQEGGIAIGYKAVAEGEHAVVIGGNGTNSAKGFHSLAMGSGTKASGAYAVALGNQSKASGEAAIAMGSGNDTDGFTEASGYASVAMGDASTASGAYAFAVGHQSKASKEAAIAIGSGTEASGSASVAMGERSAASGDYAFAVGRQTEASGEAAIAMGNGSRAIGDGSFATGGGVAHAYDSIALGFGTVAGNAGILAEEAVAIGYSSQATGNKSLAVGFNAIATDENSVALGEQAETKVFTSVANKTIDGITYDKFAGDDTGNGVVSIGKAGAEKQIVNVAPGAIAEDSTDAINGSQLFATQTVIGKMANSVTTVLGGNAALADDGAISMSDIGGTGKDTIHEAIESVNTTANAGFTISGASPTPAAVNAQIKPGETLTITGDAANTDFTQSDAGKNIYTIVGEDNTVTIGLANNLEITSVTTGDTVLTDGSLVINSTEADAAKQISLTGNGLNNGGKQITNVASGGDIETNAANIGDINSAISGSSWQIAGNDKTAVGDGVNPGEQVSFLNGNATTVTVVADGDNFTVAYDINVDNKTVEIAGEQIKAKTTTLTPETNGKITAGNTEALATADSIAGAINQSGFTVKANSETGGELINPGDSVDLVAGDHISITRDGSKFTFTADTQGLVEDAQLPVIYTNTSGDKLYRQADGTFNTVADGSGSQVQPADVIASMQDGAGNTTTPMVLGNVGGNLDGARAGSTAPTTSGSRPADLVESNAATVGDVVNSGWNLQAEGTAADFITPYDTVNFASSNKSITIAGSSDSNSTTLDFAVNTDNTTITVEASSGKVKAVTSTITTSPSGIAAAATPESLATAGSIAGAINSSGFTVKANSETGGELINPGDNVDLAAGDHMSITRDGSKFTFTADTQGLVEDAQLPVVYSKADGTRVYKRDDKFYDDPVAGTEVPAAEIIASMQHADGTLSTPTRLTNIKAGTEDADAVTISQLKGAVTALGGGAAVNADGTVNAPTYTVTDGNPSTGGTTNYTTVGAALTGLNTAVNQPITFKADTNSDTGSNGSQQQLGSEFSILSGDLTNPAFTGSNLSTEVKDGQVLIGMAKSPEFTSITLKDGANETELTTTADGLDIGGDKITNIAAGDISATSTDAVNGSQLFAATAGSKEEVISTDKSITIATTTNGAGANIYDLKVQTDAATLKFVDIDPADPSRGKQLSAVTSSITSSPAGVAAADTPSALVTAGDVASAINTSGFTAKANGDAGKLITPGEEVEFKDGDNIEITRDGGQFTVKTAKDVSFDSVTTGDTVVNNDGVTISNGTAGSAVTLSKSGLDNGGNKITNVAAGDISATSTDAVNGSQLFTVTAGSREEVISTDKSITIATTTNGAGANVYDLKVQTDAATLKFVDIDPADPSRGKQLSAVTSSITSSPAGVAAADTPGALVTAGDVASAINTSGFTAKANGDAGKLITPGDEVEFKDGDNIEITRDGGQFTVKTAKDVSFDSVTTGDTVVNSDGVTISNGAAGSAVTLSKSGLDNGGNKITNVAAGDISATSTDAVNGSQLFAATAGSKEEVTSIDKSITIATTTNGAGANVYDLSVNTDGTTIAVDTTTGAVKAITDSISVVDGKAVAATSTSLATSGDIAEAINKSGFTVKANGDAGKLITPGDSVEFDNGDNIRISRTGGQITVGTAKDVNFDSVTTGDTRVTTDGITISGGTAGQPVTLGKSGLDNGGNKITNIAAGEISATSTDAVNGSQVFALTAGSKEEVKSADQSVTITTTQNAVTGANIYDLQIQVDAATMEFVDADPADPAKGKKLTAVTSDISNDATGVATAVVGNSLTTAGSVAAAINNAGWVGTAGAGIDGGIVQGAGDQLVKTGEKVTFDAGKNIKLVQKGQSFTYATRDNVEFTKVTTGDTVMTSSGVTAPSYTTNGKHTITISGDSGTINGLTNTTFDPRNYTSGQAATEDQLASVDKVAHAGFNVSANGRNPGNIGPGETIDFNNRDGNILIQNEGNILTFDLNPDLHVNSVTTGNTQINTNGLFIKGGPSLTKEGLFINGGASVTKDGFFVDGGPSVTKKGIDAAGKPITNVARGTRPGDAVNLSQLEDVEATAAKGTAAAMAAASMPQAYAPGSSMLTAGASTYRGESAIAVGYSTMSDNGKWILQGNASANEDDAGFSVGVGYQW